MSTEKGRESERIAASYLESFGLEILARNYRSRRGEIDIIARDGIELVFVEVRRRRILSLAAESIDVFKRRRIGLAALDYMVDRGELSCRFDAILFGAGGEICWLRSAFDFE